MALITSGRTGSPPPKRTFSLFFIHSLLLVRRTGTNGCSVLADPVAKGRLRPVCAEATGSQEQFDRGSQLLSVVKPCIVVQVREFLQNRFHETRRDCVDRPHLSWPKLSVGQAGHARITGDEGF